MLFHVVICFRVVSGSRDATLRMWDIDTGHCLHVLIGHMAAVRCVQYDGRRVVSGAYDYMVKIWDPEKETCLQTLAGHTNRVYSLQVGMSNTCSDCSLSSLKCHPGVSINVQSSINHNVPWTLSPIVVIGLRCTLCLSVLDGNLLVWNQCVFVCARVCVCARANLLLVTFLAI